MSVGIIRQRNEVLADLIEDQNAVLRDVSVRVRGEICERPDGLILSLRERLNTIAKGERLWRKAVVAEIGGQGRCDGERPGYAVARRVRDGREGEVLADIVVDSVGTGGKAGYAEGGDGKQGETQENSFGFGSGAGQLNPCEASTDHTDDPEHARAKQRKAGRLRGRGHSRRCDWCHIRDVDRGGRAG